METGKGYWWYDLANNLFCKGIYSKSIRPYDRAWQDLIVSGRLQETKQGYRKNQ